MFNIVYWFSKWNLLNVYDWMSIGISLLFVVFLGAGGTLVLLDFFHVPTMKTSSAIKKFIKRQPRVSKSGLEVALFDFSRMLSKKVIRINQYKRKGLENDLKAAGYEESPEEYIAFAVVKSALFALIFAVALSFVALIICLLINGPILLASLITFIAVLVIVFFVLFRVNKSAVRKKLAKRREDIEDDLPRFIAIIAQQLQSDKDIIRIFDKFKKTTNKSFQEELSITTADMRTGNYEEALVRLESRINSSLMSDVSRGLISTVHGDSMDVFWDNLSIKCQELQKQKLKKKAMKVPRRIDKLSMVMLFCFIGLFFVAIIMQALDSLKEVFGYM